MGLVAAMVCVFAGVAWSSVQHINTLWDEMNDHLVAVSLLERPLAGSAIDATQARLPMYVTAGVYAFTGPSIRVARAVSIAMGAAAIVLTFIMGRRWFGMVPALLAAGLLSISPYFLTFARTAMTEGDAFYPAVVLLLLLAFDRYLRQPHALNLGLFAGALGLAWATKFYAVLFVPALLLCNLLELRRREAIEARQPPIRVIVPPRVTAVRGMWAWAATALGTQVLAAILAQAGFATVAALSWAAGLIALAFGAATGIWLGRRRSHASEALWTTAAGSSLAVRWLLIGTIALAVCLAICPAHVLNPQIARSLASSVLRPVDAEVMVRFLDPARLYVGIILLKSGPLLGVLTLGALGWACWQKGHAGTTFLCTTCVIYLLFLLLLPLRQNFYLMGIYPLMLLLLAAFITWVSDRLKTRERLASAWMALVATGCVYLLWGTIWAYPDFGYYGYTLIGNEWLGAESRGYRNLVQVTNDGTEDALRWLAANAPPGRRVVSYLWDDHVIDHFLESSPVLFHLVRRHAYEARESPPDIDDADYVIVAMNNELSYADVPPAAELQAGFAALPCHAVLRGPRQALLKVVKIYCRPNTTSSAPASAETD